MFLLVLLGLPASPQAAITFPAQDVRIDVPFPDAPVDPSPPRMAVTPEGHVFVVWADTREGPSKIFLNARFPEHGWREEQALPINTGNPNPPGIEQGDATHPQICADPYGRIYVVWVDNRSQKAGGRGRDIYFRYSTDYGSSWKPPFIDSRIDTDSPTNGDSIDPRIACDDDGHVYIVWRDDRIRPGTYDLYFRSLEIQFGSPTDLIQPLQFPEIRLNVGEEGKSIESGRFNTLDPDITTDGLGNVVVVWEDEREQAEREIYPGIYMNVSRNDGQTWRATDVRIDHRPRGFFRSRNPKVRLDRSGRIHVAWLDNGDRPPDLQSAGRFKLFYNHSTDWGDTWRDMDTLISTVPDRVNQVQSFDLAIDEKGGVFLVWADDRFGRTFHIFFNHSEDGGSTWEEAEENIRLDVGKPEGSSGSRNPQIRTDNFRNLFVVWQDDRGRNTSLFFNFSPSAGREDTWQPTDIRVTPPNTGGSAQGFQLAIDALGQVHVVWKDDRVGPPGGGLFYTQTLVDVRTLVVGPRIADACFIATAAYGSPLEPRVQVLRAFRDRFLLPHLWGRRAVAFYYQHSPPWAQWLDAHPRWKPLVRLLLWPVVSLATLLVQAPGWEHHAALWGGVGLLLGLLLGWVWWRRARVAWPPKTRAGP